MLPPVGFDLMLEIIIGLGVSQCQNQMQLSRHLLVKSKTFGSLYSHALLNYS